MAIVSAAAQIISGNKAVKAQKNAAANEIQLAENIFNQQRDDLEPARLSGNNARAAIDFELGIGERPTFRDLQVTQGDDGIFSVGGQTFADQATADEFVKNNNSFNYQGFKESPGRQFLLDEGNRGLERSAAARGSSQGGAFAKDLVRFNQGMADQSYQTFLNGLRAQAGAGQVATNSGLAASNAFGQQAGAATQRIGDANASSFVNTGNAIANGFNNTINTGFNAFGAGLF